jgi:hypothetical protein
LADFAFSLDKWYHYVLVADGVTDKIYVDGALIGEVEENFPLPKFSEVTVYLGTGESPSAWRVEDSALDDIMVWDKALTEDEVNTIMGGGITAVAPGGKLATTWAGMKSE